MVICDKDVRYHDDPGMNYGPLNIKEEQVVGIAAVHMLSLRAIDVPDSGSPVTGVLSAAVYTRALI